MGKFCQSCGIPLVSKHRDLRGTEKDGEFSHTFCSYCYMDGAYVDPAITLEEMTRIGLKGIDEGNGSRFAKWLLKLYYPQQLKGLDRWKK